MLKDKNHYLWKPATCEQHDKNNKLLSLCVSFSIHDVPKNKQMLRPFLVTTVKTTPSEPDIYDLRVQLCTNGSNQIVELEESCSPVCLADSLRITISLAAAFGLCLLLMHIVNACQKTTLSENQMSYIYPPPFYVELFRRRHPTIMLPDTTKVMLVVQAMIVLHGTKTAGKQLNDYFTCLLKLLV